MMPPPRCVRCGEPCDEVYAMTGMGQPHRASFTDIVQGGQVVSLVRNTSVMWLCANCVDEVAADG